VRPIPKAFVVCLAAGLETEPPRNTFRLWHGDAKLLQESLEVAQHTAAVILGYRPGAGGGCGVRAKARSPKRSFGRTSPTCAFDGDSTNFKTEQEKTK
jgi:hypothetical protein